MSRFIVKTILVVSLLVSGLASVANAGTPQFSVPAQWRTTGPGISYPDSTDPTRSLPLIDQLAFACIRFHESRNHRVDGNGSQGWYQFTQSTWASAAIALKIPFSWSSPSWANSASGDVQSEVAVWYFKRNGRFGVQWAADASSCPGTFYFNL
jgi:hypothetical protein